MCQVGGQAALGRQLGKPTPWLTERHGYDPTCAFGKIVSSLVNDIIMPPIGVLTGGMDFKDLKCVLQEATEDAEAVTLNWGIFVQNIIDFLIIAISIFCIIKLMTNLSKKKEEAPAAPAEPEPTKEEILLTEIRDLLKKQK